MAATALDGPGNLMRRDWKLGRDKDGHRTYSVTWLVESLDTDGPYTVMNATGLPAIGSTWSYGGDSDAFAYCWPTMNVQHAPGTKIGEPTRIWHVGQTFTTKPLDRCQDDAIEDPLSEPQKLSGSFVSFTREISRDRNGDPLETSSHQPLQGSEVEFDDGTPSVRVQQNVATLGLYTFSSMYNKVNDALMWGLEPRKVKLSNIAWERLLYGTCTYYYSRTFDFDINFKTFDRSTPDYSSFCLQGDWDRTVDPPVWKETSGLDEDNPQHYMRFKDVNGENSRVYLHRGRPISGSGTGTGTGTGSQEIVYIDIEYYDEANLLLLGVPSTL